MNNKKAFTVVELVIVIAIIAILAAVLIPTFASMVRSANVSADTQLIKNLNTSLRADLPDGKHPTMHDALKAAEAFGYDVDKINASAVGNEILWDQDNDVFCYAKGDSVEYIPESVSADKKITSKDDYRLWKIYNAKSSAVPAATNQSNSIYLTSSATFAEGFINKYIVGVDVGNTDVSAVTFENKSSTPKKVIIRMNGGDLVVDDTNGGSEQLFYGYADNVTVSTGSTCFIVHGVIGTMYLIEGKAIADSGAFICLTKADSGAAIERNGGIFIIPASNQINPNVDLSGVDQSEVKNEKAIEAFAKSIADEDDGTVAIIGTKKYKTLNEAVNNVKTGEIIYLVGNVEITADIGDYDTSGSDVLFNDKCLKNKVILLKDVTMTFSGDGERNIWLQEGGSINPNGFTLTLKGESTKASINYYSNDNLQLYGSTLIITSVINYTKPTNLPFGSSLSYAPNSTNGIWSWGETSFVFATAAPVVNPPGQNPDVPIWNN